MSRMKRAVGASLAVLAMARSATAQDAGLALRELRAQNAAAQVADGVRQDLLAAQREITARQDQARTDLVLRELDTARARPPGAAGLIISPPAPIMSPDTASNSFAAQMDRMERLTQDALAQGNARIRAVRPASER